MFFRRKHKSFGILLTYILLFSHFFQIHTIYGQTTNNIHIDGIMVIDVSGSMRSSDPKKISNEAIKLFTDMLSAQGDKIGLIAFSDTIVAEKALMPMDSQREKQEFKDFVDTLSPKGYTDISIALRRAVKMLDTGRSDQNKPLIVVLADGNNDLNPNGTRTEADVDVDMEEALAQAKQQGYPIYTIGLNADNKLNGDFLRELSAETGGKFFITNSANDLPQILSEIFADHLQLKVMHVTDMAASGDFQDVAISIPNANVKEANISLMTGQPVEVALYNPAGEQVEIPSDEVLYSRSAAYTMLKIMNPGQGDWNLKVKGIKGDQIKVNLIFNYHLDLEMDSLPATASKGDRLPIQAFFATGGTMVQDPELYKNVQGKAVILDRDTGAVEELPLTNTGSRFEGEYEVPEGHTYEIKVIAEHTSFSRETTAYTIRAVSSSKGTAPIPTPEEPKEEEPKAFPWKGFMALFASILVATGGVFGWMWYKKVNKPFVGQMVIEIKDENTGKKTSPAFKKIHTFRGKMNLHQLLQLAPEWKETEKILFVPGKNDRILLYNQGDAVIQKSGRALDASRGQELKNGDRISVALHHSANTVFIEYVL